MSKQKTIVEQLPLILFLLGTGLCCDLEGFFNAKQVSVEESAVAADVVFRGMTVADVPTPSSNDVGVFTAYFEMVNMYKGGDMMTVGSGGSFEKRKLSVKFTSHPTAECVENNDVPRVYIVFSQVLNGKLQATSVALWDENTDQRVWRALGWSKWSEWSPCSVSCSAGIQQRTRHCLVSNCPGFNVEQRHCNLFGCEVTTNPLALEDGKFFHPSRSRWRQVPDRPSAWRLQPNSYIWVPSTQLFADNLHRSFPREFALFVTLRLFNKTMGTIFSLRSRRRQDTYLSLEVAGPDLKLIHAASNGTDVLLIPAQLDDAGWHQVAISIRDNSIVDSYVDCEWSRTDILKSHTLDIPDDVDLIIGYLFSGDLEQLSIVSDPRFVSLQCSSVRTPITDPEIIDLDKKSG